MVPGLIETARDPHAQLPHHHNVSKTLTGRSWHAGGNCRGRAVPGGSAGALHHRTDAARERRYVPGIASARTQNSATCWRAVEGGHLKYIGHVRFWHRSENLGSATTAGAIRVEQTCRGRVDGMRARDPERTSAEGSERTSFRRLSATERTHGGAPKPATRRTSSMPTS